MLPTFVINLDRSKDRWEKVRNSASSTGLELERLPAVDGRALLTGASCPGLDKQKFRDSHGRNVLPGEYGCYRSHLAALGLVVERGLELAIIAEDDILFEADIAERVYSIMAANSGIELLKLVNHRTNAFIAYGRSGLGDDFGRCMHGPQGSAACYAVTRMGARKLLDALQTMWLPYDTAFERGWATGVATYTVRVPLVRFQPHQAETTIATRKEYRMSKLPKLGQFSVLAFRAGDYMRRAAYAMRGRWS